ncbi:MULTISPECIES: hypothetical protein [unclassified Streptomyces]|uniref:hypothetical protein n=1 Tax=unclassified Streptomyces TaxID=2593676 RepID=UPI003864BF4F|nr:hypothetical protein OG331_19990 [Streptomyces sp. NBC_01017]
MGERQSGGGESGRRRAHPDDRARGHGSGPAVALDDAELEALLSAAVLRGHRVDTEGEQRAVAAFRAARAAGAHRARTRRRDDWRPCERRRLALSVKTTLSLFVASLTLGGVAVAAIGSSGSSEAPGEDRARPTPAAGASDGPAAAHRSAAPGVASAKPAHPTTAQDTEAECRAYDQVEERGNALDSTAWQRLVVAAGGADRVAAYCVEQLAGAKSGPTNGPRNKDDGGGTTGQGQAPVPGSGDKGEGEGGRIAEKADKAGKADTKD